MNEDLLYFWGMGILFGLVMLYSKPPIGWKYFHGIIFLSYFVNAYWQMNDGNHSNGGMYSILVTIATGLHIIIYLIGKVIFGFFRRQNLKTEQRSNLNQQQNKTQEED
ncbi:MAG: hypothetical protein NWR96_08470 [Crocinitomicaceae bacterium]|jgi:hypothetical protein|nr:hypothetical protein [Crocinitomicaceae bacterium]MDP4761655.1 hypothetical protein [Crocinitomicaceae bacterium]